jgi:hypothetical protein
MQEIIVENNPLGLRVFINGAPDLKLIPKEIADSAIATLELQIARYYHKIKSL